MNISANISTTTRAWQIVTIAAIACTTHATAQHSPYIQAVDEYVPAPGQFVNELPLYEEGDDAETMAQKCTEAIADNAGGLVTLGAWGGYITFHFDHPVLNIEGQNDLYIAGNAITGNSEAGIVMVSCDDNHNGLPDDAWYDLSGSADMGAAEVWYDYELTYRYAQPLADVVWSDNYGTTGSVPRNSFHQQEYFPLWLTDQGELSFSGIRLPDNARDTSGQGSNWVLDAFAWGYADNLPNRDREANSFDISHAVKRYTRTPVYLTHIDFVRVYTALNQVAGWLGETSTEISGAEDLHPDATSSIAEAIEDHMPPHAIDLWGRPIDQSRIINHLIFIKQ